MLFSENQREKENSVGKQINFQCRCSFLEIKDDTKHGFYVEDLTEEYVTSYEDITQILIKGLSSRKVGATSTFRKFTIPYCVYMRHRVLVEVGVFRKNGSKLYEASLKDEKPLDQWLHC